MKRIFITTLFALAATACRFLDVVPEDTATMENMYASSVQTERTLNNVYGFIPVNNGYYTYPDFFLGGEVMSMQQNPVRWAGWKAMLYGQESSTSTYYGFWSIATATATGSMSYDLYRGIRYAWNFIDHVYDTPGLDTSKARVYEGEAYFLVGFLHWLLMTHYGPVVIVDHEIRQDALMDEVLSPRSDWDTCAGFVCRMFDMAAERLPAIREDIEPGRASAVAAKALKATVLMYTASPLVNGNRDFSTFLNYDKSPLIPQEYDASKWKTALDAVAEAISLAEDNGCHLWTDPSSSALSTAARGMNNYYKLFLQPTSQEGNKCEYLWSTVRGTFENTYLQQYGVPRNWDGVAGKDLSTSFRPANVPTMQAVCTFLTEDGLPLWADPKVKDEFAANHLLTIAPGDSTARLHRNRDPRFYASIAFDRGNIIYNGSEKNWIHTRAGEYHGYCGARTVYHSCTGYYFQKFISVNTQYDPVNLTINFVPYRMPYLRLAELYLDYAEACFELTGALDAKSLGYLDRVRERAGLPSFEESWNKAGGIPSGETLRKALHYEMSAELCFEGRTYDNLRRWKVAHLYLSECPLNLDVYGGKEDDEFYRLVPLKELAPRAFTYPKSYWYAIPITELNINYKLVQNPGY